MKLRDILCTQRSSLVNIQVKHKDGCCLHQYICSVQTLSFSLLYVIGEIVNIKDAYKHPKFFKDIDKTTGFHTRSAYSCIPIEVCIRGQNGCWYTHIDYTCNYSTSVPPSLENLVI